MAKTSKTSTDTTSTTTVAPVVMKRNMQTGQLMEVPAPTKTKVPHQFCRWHWAWEPSDQFFPYIRSHCRVAESKRSAAWHKAKRQSLKTAALEAVGIKKDADGTAKMVLHGNRSTAEAVAVMSTDTALTVPAKKNGKGKVAVKPDPTVMGKAPQNAKKMTPKTTNGAKVDPAIIAKARKNAQAKVDAQKAKETK